jgi:hypothetical protein
MNDKRVILPLLLSSFRTFIFLKLNVPMLIVLNRRAPRTKSLHDRTSHRYSIVDSNCSHDNQQEPITISNNKEDIYQNDLDLTDSTLRQYNDVIISSNGQDDSTVSFNDDINDDDDSDEYAYFILHSHGFFFSLSLSLSLPSYFNLLVRYYQFFVLLGCFLVFFFLFIILLIFIFQAKNTS